MKKFRIFAMALSVVILLSAFCGSTASASSLRASPTLHSYNAIATQSSSCKQSSKKGQISPQSIPAEKVSL